MDSVEPCFDDAFHSSRRRNRSSVLPLRNRSRHEASLCSFVGLVGGLSAVASDRQNVQFISAVHASSRASLLPRVRSSNLCEMTFTANFNISDWSFFLSRLPGCVSDSNYPVGSLDFT